MWIRRLRRTVTALAFLSLAACSSAPVVTSDPPTATASQPSASAVAQPSPAVASPAPSPRVATGGGAPAPEFAIDVLRHPLGASEPSLVVSESGVLVIAAGAWLREEAAGYSQ